MRYWFSFVEWGQNPDVDIRCTDGELNPAGHQEFRAMFDRMRHSVFCPAFPGDAASTRRLSEIFLAGCIPIFLGPPYHSMPFSETVRLKITTAHTPTWDAITHFLRAGVSCAQVPYKELAVFFNISDTSKWLINASPEWQLHPTIRSVHEMEARWWVPDANIQDNLVNVSHPLSHEHPQRNEIQPCAVWNRTTLGFLRKHRSWERPAVSYHTFLRQSQLSHFQYPDLCAMTASFKKINIKCSGDLVPGQAVKSAETSY